jgi:hypothetical protein
VSLLNVHPSQFTYGPGPDTNLTIAPNAPVTNMMNLLLANGSTTPRTEQERWASIKHAEDNGAIANDLTSDSSALNATIVAMPVSVNERQNVTSPSGVLQLGEGVFDLNLAITGRAGVKIKGLGPFTTVLRLRSTTLNAIEVLPDASSNVLHHWFDIEDLAIIGETNATAGAAILVTGAVGPRVRVHNVLIDQGYDGIVIENAVGGRINNVYITGPNGNGVKTVGTMNDVVFTAVGVNAATLDGWYVRGNYNHFLGIYGELCGGKGFNGFSSSGVSLGSGQIFGGFENNVGQDFYLDNARSMLVWIYTAGSDTNGVEILGANSVTANLRVDSAGGWAMKTGDGTGSSVSYGNTLLASGLFGTQTNASGISLSSKDGWKGMINDEAHREFYGEKHFIDWSASAKALFRGTLEVLQDGGVEGTDSVRITHDGNAGMIRSMDGRLRLPSLMEFGMSPIPTNNTVDVGGDLFRWRLMWAERFPVVAASAEQGLSAGSSISRDKGVARVVGNGGPVTITATPTIAAGVTNTEFVIIEGQSDVNTVTLQSTNALAGSLLKFVTDTITLGAGDKVGVRYNGVTGLWEEEWRSDWVSVITNLVASGVDGKVDENAGVATNLTVAAGQITGPLTNTLVTAGRVAVWDGSGRLTNSAAVDQAELERLDGVNTNLATTITALVNAIASIQAGITYVTNDVQTTDGTETTIATIATSSDTITSVHAEVFARTSDTDKFAHWDYISTWKNDGGMLTSLGFNPLAEDVAPAENTDGYLMNVDASGTNIRLRVQNNEVDGETINWRVIYHVRSY